MLRGDGAASCPAAADRLRGAWDETARQALRAKGPAGAATALALDGHAAVWSSIHDASCAARARGESSATLDRRDACLDLRRAQLAEASTRLRGGGPELLEDGPAFVEALPSPRDCADPATVQRELLIPDAAPLRPIVASERAKLGVVEALVATSQFAEAERLLAGISPAALAYQPFAAEIAEERADLLGSQGKLDLAFAAYDDAIRRASACGHTVVLVRAMLDRAFDLQVAGTPLPEVERWYAFAESSILGLGNPAPLRAHLLLNRVELRRKQGLLTGAIDDAQAGLELRRELGGPGHAATVRAASALGAALADAGREAEARDLFASALRDAETMLPPEHHTVHLLLGNLLAMQIRVRDTAGAHATFDRLVPLLVRVHGEDHPKVAKQRIALGSLLGTEGKHAEAIAVLETVLASAQRRDGDRPEELETAMSATTSPSIYRCSARRGRSVELTTVPRP